MIRVTFTRRSLAIGLAAFISTFVASAQQPVDVKNLIDLLPALRIHCLSANDVIKPGVGGGTRIHTTRLDSLEMPTIIPILGKCTKSSLQL